MHTVESKHKNPDKYIEKLQRQLKCGEQRENYLRSLWKRDRGTLIHRPSCKQDNDKWGTMYDDLVPGDILIGLCRVDEVRLYSDVDDNNTLSRAGHIYFTITELRKKE